VVLFFKRSALDAAGASNPKIARYMLVATVNELRRSEEHALTMGRLAAFRVASFLADVSMRMGKPHYLKLPMTLLDIADYLGLKMETVSRTLAALESSGAIVRPSYRTVVLREECVRGDGR